MNPLLIFDCDGVLVDSECIATDILLDGIRAAGGVIDKGYAYRTFVGRSSEAVLADLEREFGVCFTPEQLEDSTARLHEALHEQLRPMPGIVTALEQVALRCCVASSSQMGRIRLSLTLTGLLDSFEPHVFSATMVERGKPAPDLFLYAASKMGAERTNCVVIEDSPSGIRAAKAAGMRVLAFTGGSHAALSGLDAAVRALEPDAVFNDMHQLPVLLAGLHDRAIDT